MKLMTCLIVLFSAATSFAQIDTKLLGSEVSVMTRAVDRLMARNEMKESLPLQLFQKALQQRTMAVTTEADRKVGLLTDEQDLKNCQVTVQETKDAQGQVTDALVEYKGANCPIAITFTIHLQPIENGMVADANMKIELISEKLQKELDITSLAMPIKITVSVVGGDNGFQMKSVTHIAGRIQSQKYGLVSFDCDLKMDMEMGQEFKLVTAAVDTYISGDQKVQFSYEAESGSVQKEVYKIDGVEVSKEEFEKRREAISMPGFDDQPSPLSNPHQCNIKTYDSAVYSLEQVRKSIQDNTVESLKPAEILEPLSIAMTGKTQMPVVLAGQQIQLEVAVTDDAARFSFVKGEQSEKQELGKMTAVLGDAVDLTKLIGGRVVRITCSPF